MQSTLYCLIIPATVHRFAAMCASNSSRNLRINAAAGIAAASPKGQIVLPMMLPLMLRIRSKSSLFALAMLDPVKNLFHPVAAFAARAALAAGLVGEKTGKVPRGPHHAGGFVHDDNAARTEQTARGLNRFIVEIYFFNLVGQQHGHRTAAGNDAFEFFAVGHAAAIFFEKFLERITHFQFVDAGPARYDR